VATPNDRPSCSWCSFRADARLRVRLRWVSAFVPPILKPSCATCLVERGIAFKLDSGWPISVDVVPYDDAHRFEARITSAVIAQHRDERLT
jgi:hypothetical protein